jgi:hypothetical protein
MRKFILSAFAVVSIITAGVTTSDAASILVGQCIEFSACYNNTTPWSDNLSTADLNSLGLGTSQNFYADQTSQFIIRLGVTSITFSTSGGPVTESLAEFNGFNSYNDPGPYENDLVGLFFIPVDATSAVISGTFGNSQASSSAGVNLCLGGDGCVAATPLPAALPLFATGLGALGLLGWRRKRKAAALATA